MTGREYFQISLIPILALIVLLVDSFKQLSARHKGILQFIMVNIIALLLTESAAWMLNGLPMPWVRLTLWVINLAYFILCGTVAYMWLVYVCAVQFADWHNFDIRKSCSIAAIPLVLYLVLVVSTLFNGSVFSIDENNLYHRGPYIFVQQAMCIGYLLAASTLSLVTRSKEDMRDKRSFCLVTALFPVLPFIGAVLQILLFGTALLWPCAAASVVMLYIQLQRMQISLDYTTGLNNRLCLDNYLQGLCRRRIEPWHLILIDINGFKNINATYGHLTGDEVLRTVAELLREHFGHSEAFIARYSGDDFAVVLHDTDSYEVILSLCESLKTIIKEEGVRRNLPYPLSISVGTSRYVGRQLALDHIIDLAKHRMQEDKKKQVTESTAQ